MTGRTHHERAAADEIVSLDSLGARLLDQARSHHSRRSAQTVSSSPSMRATVIALAAGAELAEHEPPAAATLQVLSGAVRLHSAEHSWLLGVADIATIPRARHGLSAVSDAVVLLTVALSPAHTAAVGP